ncbi:MAG TPA: hypothetical protein VMG41_09985 [Gemmatimonadales bacterium]|nr:hypothetical protein [Anaeromyxobacteraceae bacterium]HTS88808.1 hypothetical protein [Gemmatimonadales bacterium]
MAEATDEPKALSSTTDMVVRSTDYTIATAEMALALSSFPAGRRNDLWLVAFAAPVGAAIIREVMRPHLLKETPTNGWALVAPGVMAIAGAGALLLTKYRGGPRRPYRRY